MNPRGALVDEMVSIRRSIGADRAPRAHNPGGFAEPYPLSSATRS